MQIRKEKRKMFESGVKDTQKQFCLVLSVFWWAALLSFEGNICKWHYLKLELVRINYKWKLQHHGWT